MEEEHTIVTLKLKSGEDIIGLFGGETEPKSESDERFVILFQPIKIKQISTNIFGRIIFSYVSDFYSLFGNQLVYVPYSNISLKSIASEFFKIYYAKQLPILMEAEDQIRMSHLTFYRNQEIKELMSDREGSFYIDPDTEYAQ